MPQTALGTSVVFFSVSAVGAWIGDVRTRAEHRGNGSFLVVVDFGLFQQRMGQTALIDSFQS